MRLNIMQIFHFDLYNKPFRSMRLAAVLTNVIIVLIVRSREKVFAACHRDSLGGVPTFEAMLESGTSMVDTPGRE